MRIIAIVFLSMMLLACGAPIQKSTTGLVEDTQLILVGEQLTGLNVAIGTIVNKKIGRSDLERYRFGVLGSADSERENMHKVTFIIKAGEHRVVVSDGDAVMYDKVLYFSDGQTREVRIR